MSGSINPSRLTEDRVTGIEAYNASAAIRRLILRQHVLLTTTYGSALLLTA